MRRAQQLLNNAAKAQIPRVASHGARPYSMPSIFRLTYNASQTVLDIDAAENEHVVPIPQFSRRKPSAPKDQLQGKDRQQKERVPSADDQEAIAAMCLTKDGARELWQQPRRRLERFLTMSHSNMGSAYVWRTSIIEYAAECLAKADLPESPALSALALQQVSLLTQPHYTHWLKMASTIFADFYAKGYSFRITNAYPGQHVMDLVVVLENGKEVTHYITSHRNSMHDLLHFLSPGLQDEAGKMEPAPTACLRDLILRSKQGPRWQQEQYLRYLELLLSLNPVKAASKQFRNEWHMEKYRWLMKPSLELSVELIARLVPRHKQEAEEIIMTWAKAHGTSASEFLIQLVGGKELEKLEKKRPTADRPKGLKTLRSEIEVLVARLTDQPASSESVEDKSG